MRLLTRRFNMQRLNHQEIPTNEGRITGDSLFYIPRKLARQASRGEIASLLLSLSRLNLPSIVFHDYKAIFDAFV